MIKVELKLQPEEGKSKKVDGLLWGGKEPMQFLGMTPDGDGLIGLDGTYLFRPVCYSDLNCFVPRRCNTFEHPSRNKVQEFPDSDPVLLVKINDWYSESDIAPHLLELKRRWAKLRKTDLIEIGKGLGLDADSLFEKKKVDLQEVVLRRKAQDIEITNTTLYIRLYMKAIVGWDEADKRLESIRYAVKYRNGEVLYLSDLEKREAGVEFDKSNSGSFETEDLSKPKARMNQAEAAGYLGRTTRTLRTWVENGWVKEHRHEEKSKPWYLREELDQAKEKSISSN